MSRSSFHCVMLASRVTPTARLPATSVSWYMASVRVALSPPRWSSVATAYSIARDSGHPRFSFPDKLGLDLKI